VSEVVNEMLRREIAAKPTQTKKVARSSKGRAELMLLGSERLLTKVSRAGGKGYAARSAMTGRFVDVQTYRTNPSTRIITKTRAHPMKKPAKRTKR
jgi:hypothetical protein